MIYFDNNATSRVLDAVAEAMRPFLTDTFANPSSAMGRFTGLDRVLDGEKARIVSSLGGDHGGELLITSGATESNNLALLGAARANPQRRHLVVSAIEHPSVLEVAASLKREGYRVTVVPVDKKGEIVVEALVSALTPETLLVSVMLANNETGVLQPVQAIARAVKHFDGGILVHTDATQAVGKIPLDLGNELDAVDLLSFSAHKFHGPKGTGGLVVRSADLIAPVMWGGGQQQGMRPGTENPSGVIGMGSALRTVLSRQNSYHEVGRLRDRVEARVLSIWPQAFSLGNASTRLPTTAYLCLPGVDADHLVDLMAVNDVAISAGSACSYGAAHPSHVAIAMGLSHQEAKSCIRVSLSLETESTEVEALLAALELCLRSHVDK